eukprot:UN34691
MGSEKDRFLYDKIIVDDQCEFNYCESSLFPDLMKTFPKEKEAIMKHKALVDKFGIIVKVWGVTKLLPIWLGNIIISLLCWVFPVLKLSWSEYLDSLTDNVLLKTVLCGNFGDTGGAPADSSMVIAMMIQIHYNSTGVGYPDGGTDMIVRSLIPGIERAGGRVLVRAEVTNIIVVNGAVQGVEVIRKNSNMKPVLIQCNNV